LLWGVLVDVPLTSYEMHARTLTAPNTTTQVVVRSVGRMAKRPAAKQIAGTGAISAASMLDSAAE